MTQFLPCLIERWERWAQADGEGVLRSSWDDVRRDVLRNLEWLLNTEARTWLGRYAVGFEPDGTPKVRPEIHPDVLDSVLMFGVPPFAGRVQSQLKSTDMAREIMRRVLAFEPRIHAESLEVQAYESGDRKLPNLLRFVVQGHLRANPLQAFEVRTELDLETGQARVEEV